MPDSRLTALTELTTLAEDDWLYWVDKSDTTDDAAGSSRKVSPATLSDYHFGFGTNAITGAATAVFGKINVCSGTSADYTVTLPTAGGNANKVLRFRMSTALTKLVTLDGNGTETIDGELTRVMHAGETAALISDGSNWFKVSGRTIPMQARIEASVSQSLTSNTFNLLTLGTVAFDVGALTGTANTITARRANNYIVGVSGTLAGVTAGNTCIHSVYRNGLEFRRVFRGPSDAGGFGGGANSAQIALSAGDALRFATYGFTGTISTEYIATVSVFALTLLELPTW